MMWARLASAVVVIQAIVTALTFPLLKSLTDQQGSQSQILLIALVLLLVPAVFRRPGGRWVGEVVEIVALVISWQVPALFVLTLIFYALWRYALRIGMRIDKDRSAAASGE
jgi:Kef-type K+ transport system membrane component KefB